MARYKRSFDEQLNILEGQIAKAQDKLDSLISQRESIMARKREEEIGELYQVLLDHQLTVQDVLEMVEGDADAEASA